VRRTERRTLGVDRQNCCSTYRYVAVYISNQIDLRSQIRQATDRTNDSNLVFKERQELTTKDKDNIPDCISLSAAGVSNKLPVSYCQSMWQANYGTCVMVTSKKAWTQTCIIVCVVLQMTFATFSTILDFLKSFILEVKTSTRHGQTDK